MTLQLELAEINDRLLPGRFLLANVYAIDRMFDVEIGRYWPALVIDKSLAPAKIERRQEDIVTPDPFAAAEEEHLIWLIGRNKFLWIGRSHLRKLHASQLEAFKASIDEKEVTSLLEIGLKQTTSQNLQMFGDQIMDDAALINGGDSILTPGVGLFGEGLGRGPKRPREKHPLGRSMRARLADPSTPAKSIASIPFLRTPSTSVFLRTPSTSVSMEAGTPVVKQEPNEDDLLSRKERVLILLGRNNTEFTCSKINIAKSPVLSAYLMERPGQQPYIMNPALKDVDPEDFKCIIDFLQTDMYAPALVEAPASRSDPRKYVLDGIVLDRECTREIQRCGRLHVLAKTFQIPSLVDYIFTKVTDVRYKTSVVKRPVLLELTKTVFSGGARHIHTAAKGQEQEGALEGWLVEKIVEKMERITTDRETSRLFWEVMRAGSARGLAAEVFRGRAALEDKSPDVIKIEDD